ncbi:MAG: MFS transporter [Fervidicoccaceae archaeon]
MEKPLWIISASVFAFSFTTAVINLTSGLRVYSLSHSPSLLSLTTLVYNVLYTITSYYYGKIAYRRLSQVELLITSFSTIGLTSLLMGIIPDPYAVISMNAFFGAGAAIGSPTLTAALVSYLMKDSIAVTRYNILVSLGTIFGYLTAAFMGSLPSSYILIFNGAILLFFTPLPAFLPPKFKVKMQEKIALAPMLSHLVGRVRSFPSEIVHWEKLISFGEAGREMRKMLRIKIGRASTLTLIGTVALFTAINTFFTPMPAYLKIFKYNDKEIYALYLLSNFTTLLLYDFIKGKVGSWNDTWKVLVLSVSTRPFLFLLPLLTYFVHPIIIFPVLYIAVGATWAGISASLPVISMMHASPEKKGESVSKMNAMTSLGAILGSFLASVISEFGIIYTSLIASILAAASALIFKKASSSPVD